MPRIRTDNLLSLIAYNARNLKFFYGGATDVRTEIKRDQNKMLSVIANRIPDNDCTCALGVIRIMDEIFIMGFDVYIDNEWNPCATKMINAAVIAR